MSERQDHLWTEVPGLPDAVPAKRPRGRPPKPKPGPEGEAQRSKPAVEPPPHRQTVSPQSMAAVTLAAMLSTLDFSKLGTADRFCLVICLDTSPSVRPFEAQAREGGNAIAPTLEVDPLARSLCDVVLTHFSDDFEVVSAQHVRDFRMPAGVTYGLSTNGAACLRGLMDVCTGYESHLAKLGLGVNAICVVLASDFRMGGWGFGEALEAFRAWQSEAGNKTVVVPAYFGDALPEVAERVSVAVKPQDLQKLNIRQFLRIVAQSARTASRARPGLAREAFVESLNKLTAE